MINKILSVKKHILLTTLILTLTGCGQTGPLYLPCPPCNHIQEIK